MFGLIKAIDNFDVSLNVQFSTYAVPMIIGEIRRYLRDNNPIRVSRSVRDLAYRALQAKEKIIKEKDDQISYQNERIEYLKEKEQELASIKFSRSYKIMKKISNIRKKISNEKE